MEVSLERGDLAVSDGRILLRGEFGGMKVQVSVLIIGLACGGKKEGVKSVEYQAGILT